MDPSYFQRHSLLYAGVVVLAALGLTTAGCSDDMASEQNQGQSEEDCAPDEDWNPIQESCVVSDNGNGDGDSDAGTNQSTPDDVDDDPGESCENLECDVVECPSGQSTTISGTVHIPSGELPLPDVAVYVPNSPVESFVDGASCEPCEDELSASPAVETETDLLGEFVLEDAPVGDEIPVVVEVGKWRRQMTVQVQECQDNPIDDEDARLPRNQSEGELPSFAVTTGGWDALECLIKKIGVDTSEFTPEDGDGRVNLFAGRGGADRYDNSLNSGASFTKGWDWWDDLDNLLDYDIVLHSCEGSGNLDDKSVQARDALLDFTHAGGRVFLSHWHHIWLDEGPADFQAVANWGNAVTSGNETGYIDNSFDKGQMLWDWMIQTGTTPAGEFPINETRGSIESIDENLAQQWVWIEPDDLGFNFPGMPEPPDELIQYFSFNTPIDLEPENQCGRVVFSDIHVAAGDDSSPDNPFPTGCTSGSLTPQEKALVFMLFDLSRCITADWKKDDDW